MKTAISLPDSVFDEAERLARDLGLARSQLYAAALVEYIARHRNSTVTAELDAVYAAELSDLDPAFAENALRTLRDTEW